MIFNFTIKMRIYIITLHRTHNYGSVLQSFALQNVLINTFGQDVIIDTPTEGS